MLTPVEGEIFVVDKPIGWSSFHVVKKLRGAISSRLRKVGVRNLKVGHAGTLDPLASGVMLICTGRATKRIESLQSGVKEYEATIQLGATTPSFDRETPVDATYPTGHITRELIETVLCRFTGCIEQVPPSYSACKVDGHRAYKIARRGDDVTLKPKTLVIDAIELLDFDRAAMVMSVRVVCSKGTYIRALARDIGVALGSGGYLTALRRTRVGDRCIDDALLMADVLSLVHKSPMAVTDGDGVMTEVPVDSLEKDFVLNERVDIKPFDER